MLFFAFSGDFESNHVNIHLLTDVPRVSCPGGQLLIIQKTYRLKNGVKGMLQGKEEQEKGVNYMSRNLCVL